MKVPDVLRLNDWEIRRFIIIVSAMLIAYNSAFLAKIPILVQLLGFIVLTFIPGFIILRILKVHNVDRTVNILLVIGLSLSFLMILGFIMNIIYPHFGIKPMTALPLLYTLDFIIIILLFISYIIDKNFRSYHSIKILPSDLALTLLPILAIFSAYLMAYHNLNYLNIFLLFLLSLIPVLIAFNKLRPYSIFTTALAILWCVNLSTTYLWSYDIFFHARASMLVLKEGSWDPNEYPLLLFAILAPAYSLLCDLSLIWVFKIIFPLFFALTPLALYKIYRCLINNDKLALLSIFVFIYYYGFFKDMPDKQHIAELFLALTIMSALTTVRSKNVIVTMLLFSLIVSHYGVSHLFMFSLILASTLYYLNLSFDKNVNIKIKNMENKILRLEFVILATTLVIGWYMFTSTGKIFENIVRNGWHVLDKLICFELFKADHRSGIKYLEYQAYSILWQIYKIINIKLQLLIFLGVVKLLSDLIKGKLNDLACLSLTFYLFLALQVTTTYGMGMDRVLQITLLLLSPLAMIGWMSLTSKMRVKMESSVKIFSMYLMIFFLFSSGVIFAISGDKIPPYCIALNKNAGWPAPNEGEVMGGTWCKRHIDKNVTVKLAKDGLLLYYLLGGDKIEKFWSYHLYSSHTYLYIGLRNEEVNEIINNNNINIINITLNLNTIYNNQNCIIFV